MLCVLVLFREFVMAIWPLIPLHPNPAPTTPNSANRTMYTRAK
jgi:hypothetical protein